MLSGIFFFELIKAFTQPTVPAQQGQGDKRSGNEQQAK